MVWSWSHTASAIESVQYKLETMLSFEELREIQAEWKSYAVMAESFYGQCETHSGDFNRYNDMETVEYHKAYDAIAGKDDIDYSYIWEKVAEQALCSNGGYEAWLCPYGCHTVSFS